jgi:hypothetical protein
VFTAQLYLPGDANRDLAVNGSDFALLAANFGRTGRSWSTGDFNDDTAVNGADFALLASHFGRSLGGGAAGVGGAAVTEADYAAVAAFGASIPEPSSAVLLLVAAGVSLSRRPRRRH